jgi:phosphoenolpyruvate synthase/pyruvate phosphate dikinase
LPILCFKADDYKKDKNSILDKCIDSFSSKVIVRSSSQNEDNLDISNAGKYNSLLNVLLEKQELDKAIQEVISSYGCTCEGDEVFIQPMLENVSMSGVVFTADIDTLAPYYIVNYDTSGSTSTVTNGESNNLKTAIFYKNAKEIKNKKLELLLKASKECEDIFNNNFLDIEFAFSKDELYVLQVRAIVTKDKIDLSQIDLQESLKKIYKKIKKLNSYHPKLLGKKSIFGVMPDWNPAEIIGKKPKKLALSLYKELITDSIWAYQRDNYGYRNLRSFPLMVSFLGVPFIDVRVSFNSFVPKNLGNSISSKLVDFYLDKLSQNASYHDKIEFKIIYSCYFFGISKKLELLLKNGFEK